MAITGINNSSCTSYYASNYKNSVKKTDSEKDSINAPRAQPLPRRRASRPAQSGRHLAGAWRPIRPYTKNLQAQPPKAVKNISKTLAHFRFYAYNKDKPLGARCAPPKM